jgi:uncharacterized protein (DUF1778 family)
MSLGAFVLSHAADAARDLLADRSNIALSPERWANFVALLEGPARPDATDFVAAGFELAR